LWPVFKRMLSRMKGFVIGWVIGLVVALGIQYHWTTNYCAVNAPWNAQHWAQRYYPGNRVVFNPRSPRSAPYMFDVYGTTALTPFTINCDCSPNGACRVYSPWRLGE